MCRLRLLRFRQRLSSFSFRDVVETLNCSANIPIVAHVTINM